jgi:hypothetical protein
MSPQQINAYLNLIEQLLSCPEGQEWKLLKEHQKLVNPELLQIMNNVATQLARDGEFEGANFLHHWVEELNHIFMQAVNPQNNEAQSQPYINLIQKLLDCPEGKENEVLAANEELIDLKLLRIMKQVATHMALQDKGELAVYLNNLAAQISQSISQQVNDYKAKQNEKGKVRENITNSQKINYENDNKPLSKPKTIPANIPNLASSLPVPSLYKINNLGNTKAEECLAVIAESLNKLESILTSRLQPVDPLWYMSILERAHASNWIITTEEIEQLIGIKPKCEHGSNSFKRGCWVFVKVGKMGLQTAWRVKKEHLDLAEESQNTD